MGEPASPPSGRDGELASPAGQASWDDIRIFNAIAVGGSMAVAAAQLGLSEATVARRLKGFETELGLQLFTREANRLVPTAIGMELASEVGAEIVATSPICMRADLRTSS